METQELELLGKSISKGKSLHLKLDIAKLHTHTTIEVPIIVERAKKDGPTILLTGGIHGNEINGIDIVRNIISRKFNKPTAGMVICIPVVNIFGFLNQTRQFPDGRDLNRVFPGSVRGSLASRFAYHIVKEIVPLVDYCIDFHTGGDSRFNAPQIRVDFKNEESLRLAKLFGAPFVVDSDERDKSFRQILNNLGKKVLLFEGGMSLNINAHITQTGVRGTLRIMHELGVRDFKKEIEGFDNFIEHNPNLISSSTWIRANHSGIFHPDIELGQRINKRETLGTITDPYGFFEKKIKARNSGYVICLNRAPLVNQGDAIIHMSKDN